MIRILSLIVLCAISATATALDATDAGTYAVFHRDGHLTDFTFFASLSDDGLWHIERPNPDGSWKNVTCERDCILRESNAQDIKRLFPPKVLENLIPNCVHNTAFAFCNYRSRTHPENKSWLFIGLVSPQPIPLWLRKISNDRSTFKITTSSTAQDSKEVRILDAVKRIIAIQQAEGEHAAIQMLQACYQSLPTTNVILKVEECVAQDIAYANFSSGMYRNYLKSAKQPEYITMEAMTARVYAAARNAGLSAEDSNKFLRIVAPIALSSLSPAIQSLPHP